MLSLEQLRATDPTLKDIGDDELTELRDALYEMAQTAFQAWWREKNGSKNPVRSFPNDTDRGTF